MDAAQSAAWRPVAVGEFAVDHRDAAFALAQAKIWLSYIARLLRDSGTG